MGVPLPARPAEDVEAFRSALAMQQALGVPAEELTPERGAALVPQLDLEGVLAATFCGLDGYCSPEGVVQWYARGAAERGVRIRQGCTLTGVRVERGRIEAVETSSGSIATSTLVCTAGAWSADVAALAGVDLPVQGQPRHLWFYPADGGLPARAAADDRLLDELLLPPRGPGARVRREGTRARGRCRARRAAAAGPRRFADRVLVVGLLRRLAGRERARRRERPRRRASSTRPASRATASSRRPPSASTSRSWSQAARPTLDLSAFDVDRFARGAERRETVVICSG